MKETAYPTTEYIKTLLNKYIPQNKKDKKGLFLLPLQTGSGKTHATVEYMKEHLQQNKKGLVIYAVHTLHNVKDAYTKLIESITDEDKTRVIFLKNNYDAIVDALIENDKSAEVFKILPRHSEFQSLKSYIDIIKKSPELRYKESYKKTIELENANLRTKLSKLYKQGALSEEEIEEVNILYPTNALKKYSVVFMTTSKLYYPLFTLNGSMTLYRDSAFKNALLFLDEFDTQKKVLLNNIVQDIAKNSYEFIDLFLRITDTLKSKQFANKYNIDPDIIESIRQVFERVFQTYHMEYGFKYNFQKEIEISSILMNSTFSNIVQGQSNTDKIDTSRNQQNHTNYISSSGDLSFSKMLVEISTALRRFTGMVSKIAKIEVGKTQEKAKKFGDFSETPQETLDRITRDIIKELGYTMGDRHYNYLEDVIKHNVSKKQRSFKSSTSELYEDGFKIINITQHSKNSKTNDFEFVELTNTPENFMKEMCQQFFVTGISATATIESLMQNFDLDYLKSKVNLIELSQQEIKYMDQLYIEAKKQADRDIHIEYVYNREIIEMIDEYFAGGFHMEEPLHYLSSLNSGAYNLNRLIKILHAYREFLIRDEIESFLVLMSALPSEDKDVLNPENLTKLIFEMMTANYNRFDSSIKSKIDRLKTIQTERTDFIQYLIDTHELFYIYNSEKDNLERYNAMFQEKQEKHEKIFIISAYQTIGVGANLEYTTLDSDSTKDFDAIFLDAPTSFFQKFFNKEPATREAQKLRAIFELESLTHRGYFTPLEYSRYAKFILLQTENYMPYNKTSDHSNSVMSAIIQAIGRLYRTDTDTSKMFIYLDSDIAKSVRNFNASKQTLLPAVHKLIDHTNAVTQRKESDESLMQAVNLFKDNNAQLSQKITYMLRVFSSKNIDAYTVKEWEKFRGFLVQNPTVKDKAVINSNYDFGMCYESVPDKYSTARSYYYSQTDDYDNIEISFENESGYIEMSPKSALLGVVAKTKELRGCVEENNICLEFKHPNLMTPIAFNNLYKGALGEVLGKYLIEHYCRDIKLLAFDINRGDEYERFDYKTEDESCYFDFKYYSQSTLENTTSKELTIKAKNKLKEMSKAKRAVIVNIFAQLDDYQSKKCYYDENVMIVPFLIDYTDREKPKLEMEMFVKIMEFIR